MDAIPYSLISSHSLKKKKKKKKVKCGGDDTDGKSAILYPYHVSATNGSLPCESANESKNDLMFSSSNQYPEGFWLRSVDSVICVVKAVGN